MILPHLLLGGEDQPSPVVAAAPRYQVFCNAKRVLRTSVTAVTWAGSAHGGAEWGAALRVPFRGRRYVNPGLVDMVEGAPVIIVRDGFFKVFDGFMDTFDIDPVTGWVKFKCLDTTADVDRTHHGLGLGTGDVTGSWLGANAVVGVDHDSPWGDAVTVQYGSEPDNQWHFAYRSFYVNEGEQLKMSAIVNLAKGSSKTRIITLSKRFLDKPKAYQTATAAIPTDAAVGKWSREFSLPTVEGEPGRIVLVDVAVWSPMTAHQFGPFPPPKPVNKAALRAQIQPLPPVATDDGGDSVDLVVQEFDAAFAQAGGGGVALKVGPGLVFDRGVSVPVDDKSSYGALIGAWSATAEWRWASEVATVQVAGIGGLGTFRPNLRVTSSPVSKVALSKMGGASKGQARYVTVSGKDGDRDFETFTDAGSGRGWDVTATAPEGVDIHAYAEQVTDSYKNPGRPIDVSFQAPVGGRTPGDLIVQGLAVYDSLPQNIDAGFASQEGPSQRVTSLKLEPIKGDRLTGTLEPL